MSARVSTPFAGANRIRFEGLRFCPHSQRSGRSPVVWLHLNRRGKARPYLLHLGREVSGV